MKTIIIGILGLASACFAVTLDNSIGVYFDQDGLRNCIARDGSPRQHIKAYIIAKNMAGGISGWEAALTADRSLELHEGLLAAGGINFSEFPRYRVGLGSPIPPGGPHILAEFTVVASDSGSIFLEAVDQPSIPGSNLPLYHLDGGSNGGLREFAYEYGSADEAVATIGRALCPLLNVDDEGADVGDIPPVVYDPDVAQGIIINSSYPAGHKEVEDFQSVLTQRSLAFIGRLLGYRMEALTVDRWSGGFAICRFEVTEPFWGTSRDRYEVLVKGYDIPGKIYYHDDTVAPLINESTIGHDYLVAANSSHGNLQTYMHGCILLDADPGRGLFNESELKALLDRAEEVKRRVGYEYQVEAASLIVEGIVEAKEATMLVLRPTRVFKGVIEDDTINIRLRFFMGKAFPYFGSTGSIVLAFVGEVDGEFVALCSGRSIVKVTGQGYLTGDGNAINIPLVKPCE